MVESSKKSGPITMLSKNALSNVFPFINDKEFCVFRGVNKTALSSANMIMDRRIEEIEQR